MYRCIFILFALASAQISFAYEVQPVTLDSVFEQESVVVTGTEQWYVGQLQGFPHTFEFRLTDPATVELQLMVLDSAKTSPSLILVKEVERGVSEVMRRPGSGEWEKEREPLAALTLDALSAYSAELAAGTYRFEVSSTRNEGRYAIRIGSEEGASSYFGKLTNALALRSHVGASPVGIILSPLVFMPLFIVLSGLFFGWYVRKGRYQST